MELIHLNCGGTLYINLSPFIHLKGEPIPRKDGVDIRKIVFDYTKKDLKNILLQYTCEKCGEVVPINDILVKCDSCKRILLLNEVTFSNYSGGMILCNEKCVTRYNEIIAPNEIIKQNDSLQKILTNLNITASPSLKPDERLIKLEENIETLAPPVERETITSLENERRGVTYTIDGREFPSREEFLEFIRETQTTERRDLTPSISLSRREIDGFYPTGRDIPNENEENF